MPWESASITLSGHPLDLNQHNTFSPLGSHISSRHGSRAGTGASSLRRGISPLRETNVRLKYALPPIQAEPFVGAQLLANGAIRGQGDGRHGAARVMAGLWLSAAVPPGACAYVLNVSNNRIYTQSARRIISDNALGVQTLDRQSFIDSPRNLFECNPPSREELQYTLKKVMQKYQRAITCKTRGRDGDASCLLFGEHVTDIFIQI
jgi:hypothetical protein